VRHPPPTLEEAIERLAHHFDGSQTRQGLLARRALGRPAPGDAALTLTLIRHLAAEVRRDGTVRGGFLPTAFRLLELTDLGADEETAAVPRLTAWLVAQQGLPGCYSDGCTKPRHEAGACEHFLQGFFTPAPAEHRVAPVSLPNGKVFRAEPAARFALSCLALRALMGTTARTYTGPGRHLASLTTLRGAWEQWDGYFPPDLVLTALRALASAPGDLRSLGPITAFVASHQAPDGSWPQADRFVALEALLEAGTPEAAAAIRRAAPALAASVRADGSFGPVAQQERGLIGLKALLAARA
jgi:hypothetical protein